MSSRRDLGMQYFGEGSALIRNAIAMDKGGNVDQAKKYYRQAASKFTLAINQKDLNEQFRSKAVEHKERCEQRADELDRLVPVEPPTPAGGGQAQTPKPSGGNSGGNSGGGKGSGGKGKGGDQEDENDEFSKKMENAILVEKPNIKWDDVAGLKTAKRALTEAVILPMKFKQFFTGERAPWRGILLYGPPGTGKSFLAKATASEANNSTFLTVSTSDLVSKWLGESEKLIKALFEMARKKAPAIIFIDEIDSLLSERSENDSESARRIKTEFLIQMDGVGKSMDGILLLAATNIPWGLDPAVRRRFEKKIYIPLPEPEAREVMIRLKLKSTFNTLTEAQILRVAEITEGYSGADIKILTREAAMLSIRKLQESKYFREYQGKYYACGPNDPGAFEKPLMELESEMVAIPPVTFEHFTESINKIRPSVSPNDLGVFEKWTQEFGQEGN